MNVPPPERRRRDRQRTFSLPAAFLRCTPFRELYNSTARGSGCRASESDPAGRGAKYREDVRCAWRCDGEQAGADGEVGGSCSALDLDYTVMYTVFSTLMVSSPLVVTRRRKDRTVHARTRFTPTATPWRIALRTLARTPDGDAESLSDDYIDAMHIAPNATEPRGRGG